MHMGTANSGHYYSYIRPRDVDGEWLEFNDTVVSTFDVKVLLGAKFGHYCTVEMCYKKNNRRFGNLLKHRNGSGVFCVTIVCISFLPFRVASRRQ